jgi:hypothetical protein
VTASGGRGDEAARPEADGAQDERPGRLARSGWDHGPAGTRSAAAFPGVNVPAQTFFPPRLTMHPVSFVKPATPAVRSRV